MVWVVFARAMVGENIFENWKVVLVHWWERKGNGNGYEIEIRRRKKQKAESRKHRKEENGDSFC